MNEETPKSPYLKNLLSQTDPKFGKKKKRAPIRQERGYDDEEEYP
jgi:hypothetical protein